METIYWLSYILVLVGAINWGLVACFKFDLVAALLAGSGDFGAISTISRVVYGLVGISAIYLVIDYFAF